MWFREDEKKEKGSKWVEPSVTAGKSTGSDIMCFVCDIHGRRSASVKVALPSSGDTVGVKKKCRHSRKATVMTTDKEVKP